MSATLTSPSLGFVADAGQPIGNFQYSIEAKNIRTNDINAATVTVPVLVNTTSDILLSSVATVYANDAAAALGGVPVGGAYLRVVSGATVLTIRVV